MKIENNNLTGSSSIDNSMETPNNSGPFNSGLPDMIIIHYTAGASAKSSAAWLCNPEAKASAHLVIGQKGEIIQLAPFNQKTWHAGSSAWEDRVSLNNFSIGIEIDNPGVLEKRMNGYYTYFGSKVSDDLVIEAVHRNEQTERFWHAYTAKQISIVEEICRLLVGKYPIKNILGHEEVSPGRKIDPGPAFPLDTMRERVLYGQRTDDAEDLPVDGSAGVTSTKGIVTASQLNIRANPSLSAMKVADPIKKGTIVQIQEEKNGWYKVKVEMEGWVSKEYVKS